jgi:hypothetical protein
MRRLNPAQLDLGAPARRQLLASIAVREGVTLWTRCPYCGSDDLMPSQRLEMPHGYCWKTRCNGCASDLGTAEQQTEAILAAFRAMQEQEVA